MMLSYIEICLCEVSYVENLIATPKWNCDKIRTKWFKLLDVDTAIVTVIWISPNQISQAEGTILFIKSVLGTGKIQV